MGMAREKNGMESNWGILRRRNVLRGQHVVSVVMLHTEGVCEG